jgi:hypothetical protein
MKNTLPPYIFTDASKKPILFSFVQIYLTLMYKLDNNYCKDSINKINSLYKNESCFMTENSCGNLLQIITKYNNLLLELNDFHLLNSKKIQNYMSDHDSYENLMTSGFKLERFCCKVRINKHYFYT